jgi:TetR/AcrR family transcriptional repressor of nem operon
MACASRRELAITLFARVQGAALLANTPRDPNILARELRRLERWIDELGVSEHLRARAVSAPT